MGWCKLKVFDKRANQNGAQNTKPENNAYAIQRNNKIVPAPMPATKPIKSVPSC